ncbi:MAG: hypothetical protein LBH11_04465 [Propionibacteriaceae bacterium]|nr:hypothetical protein [Propionibacteriaceae bacterium]
MVVATFLLLGSLAACVVDSTELEESGSAQSTPGARLAASFSAYLEQRLPLHVDVMSDFEKEVLGRAVDSGQIEAADYEEAFSRYMSCMAERGFVDSWHKNSFGIYAMDTRRLLDPASEQLHDEAFMDCSLGVMYVLSFYDVQQTNPELLVNPREVALECLQRNGFVDGDYTLADLDAATKDGFQRATFDPYDPLANDCLYAGGMTVVLVEE